MNRALSLAALGLITGVSVTAIQGCDSAAENLCGPCGSIATGQLSIAGNAQLDGFFTAVADLQGASLKVRGNFEGELQALGNIYGMGDAAIDGDFAGNLVAAIRADIAASVSGGIRLNYTPPRCAANVNVAVEAQASCEASASCDVEVDPGEVSVECSGQCTGSCEGECSGGIACTPPSGSVGCDVGCEGECVVEGGAACEGTCSGECDGECSVVNADGSCAGQCDGTCMGSCELSGMAMCEGTCHGTCHASVTPPGCMAEPVTCEAECMGMCSGGCEGEFRPPSASADCEASAECEASASAQAEASLECTPPSLDFGFEFAAGVDATGRAEFRARLNALRVHLAAALQAAGQAQVLFTGELDGEVVFETSPFARVQGEIQGLISGGVDGFAELDIPKGRLLCVIPAFQEAGEALVGVGADLSFTATSSAELFAFVGNP